jgi:hypothetical protein
VLLGLEGWLSDIDPRISSSGSDSSLEVRGDSVLVSCAASKIDCLDIDDASVLLPPSPRAWCATCAGTWRGDAEVPSPALPVIKSLLKASTSIDALPELPIFGVPSLSRCVGSIVANVFENGFAGTFLTLSTTSSSEISDTVLSKGSSPSCCACVA